jgi:hypothetical protein
MWQRKTKDRCRRYLRDLGFNITPITLAAPTVQGDVTGASSAIRIERTNQSEPVYSGPINKLGNTPPIAI